MSLSRRAFVRVLVAGGAGAVIAGGSREPLGRFWSDMLGGPLVAAEDRPLLLHNNENPLGPGELVLDAVRAALRGGPESGRYPGGFDALAGALADGVGVQPANVLTGCGSTQLLRTAVQVFTSRARPLLASFPAYEECSGYAALIGSGVRTVPLDAELRHDLTALAGAVQGAGLVFIDNPGNPTATVHGGDAVEDFIALVAKASPETTVLIDEAYFDYATDPTYRTMIPVAVTNPRVVVARTFSKAHGMAGLRVGYVVAHPDTIRVMRDWEAGGAMNLLGVAGAIASIKDPGRIERERARNTDVCRFTIEWFARAGFTATDSHTNFLFVNLRRPVRAFRDACRAEGVLVARDFPPFENSHVRISLGTMEEMRRATAVFGKVLGVPAAAAA